MTRHTVEIAGRRISWLQSGTGRPVVLVHGFPLHGEMWRPQHDAVPHGFTLITPDLRGLGSSSGPPARSLDEHADDLLALLRHLGLERAIIGGLSMGGYVTFAIYRKAPQRFAAMVLADTRAEADSEDARAARIELQGAARQRGVEAVLDAMMPKLIGPSARHAGTVEPRVRAIAAANGAEGIIDALEALRTRLDSTSTLASIRCPVLVIVGAEDALTPPAVAEGMVRAIPGARLSVVPGAGHMSNLEQPEAFDAALWDFARTL